MVMETTTTTAMTAMTVMNTTQKMSTGMASNMAGDKDERAIQVTNLSSAVDTEQIKKGLE
jgi:hypothetical protein